MCLVQQGSVVDALTCYVDDQSTTTVNISGGTVGEVQKEESEGSLTINVSGGMVGVISLEDWMGTRFLTISGGTVSSLSVDLSNSSTLDVTGGVVGSVAFYGDGSGEANVSGGTIDHITLETPYLNAYITGGRVGIIESTQDDDVGITIDLSGCTVGEFRHNLAYEYMPMASLYDGAVVDKWIGSGKNEWNIIWAPAEIGKNCRIERLDHISDGDGSTLNVYRVAVGANSIVKLSPSVQRLVTLGKLIFNADPTAQIINLED